MSSCFPLFSKFKIPKIITSLSAIGTFFCYKKGDNIQSSIPEESPTNSSNNSPRNNGDDGAINSSELSGANTQNGDKGDSNSSSYSSMISISPESSYYTLSRTQSPELLEPLSDFTPPINLSAPRNARGVSRSDAREGAKSPLRFTSAPEFSSKFPIDNSKNNESLKDNDFIKNYIDRIINNMKSSDSAKEDEASKSLSDPQNLDLHSKIMRGRDKAVIRNLSSPTVTTRPMLPSGTNVGVGRKSAFTLVPATTQEIAIQIVDKARRDAGGSRKVELTF